MIETYTTWLQQDHDRVADRIRAATRQETPAYAAFPDEAAEASWAAGIDRGLHMFTSGVADGRRLTADERAVMEAIGRQRAEQGFPLDAIVASIAVAARVAFDWVLARVDGPLSDEERAALAELSARLTTFANRITAPALHAYLARREALATTAEQARTALFHDLLGGRLGNREAAAARAAVLDVDLTVPWAVLLVPPNSDGAEDKLLAVLPGAVPVPMTSTAVPHTALVAPAPAETWPASLQAVDGVTAGHGSVALLVGPCDDVVNLHRRYAEVRTVIPHLHRLSDSNGVLDADELQEAALLVAVPEDVRAAFANRVLGPIERQSPATAAKHLRTLEALLLHDNSVKAAAAAVGHDTKTIRSHMDRVEALTGLSFDRLLHLRWFGTALLLRRLDPSGQSDRPPRTDG